MGKDISMCIPLKSSQASKRWRQRNKVHLTKARESHLNMISSIYNSKQRILAALRSRNSLELEQIQQYMLVDILNLSTSGAECEQLWSTAKHLEFVVLSYIRPVEMLCGLKY